MTAAKANITMPKDLLAFADMEAAELGNSLGLKPDRCRSLYISRLVRDRKKKSDARKAKLLRKG